MKLYNTIYLKMKWKNINTEYLIKVSLFFTTSDYGSDYTVIERFDSSSNLLSLVTLDKNEVEVSLAHCHPIEEITLTSYNIDEETLSSKIAGVFVDAVIDTFNEKEHIEEIQKIIEGTTEEYADTIEDNVAITEILSEKAKETLYYEFPKTFTNNLANSEKMLQLSLGLSTQNSDIVLINVEAHKLKLASVIIELIDNFSEDDIKGEKGRQLLANSIKDALNSELEELEGFGGIEGVHFTSFVMQ